MRFSLPLWVWSHPSRRFAVAGALFATIFALQLTELAAGWSMLYVIPVLLVAQSAGARGGAVAGVLGLLLVAAWAQIRGVNLPGASYFWNGAALMSLGLVAGARATQLSHAKARSGLGKDDDHSGAVLAPDPRSLDALSRAGIGEWVLDLESGRTQWSDEYRRLYGLGNDQEMTRAAFQQLMRLQDRHLLEDAIRRIAIDGTTVDVRYRIIRPDGVERIIRSHLSARSAGPKGRRTIIGTAQDVTDLVTLLTPREAEMLSLLADGLSGEEIAARLVLSPATVRTHVQNAMVKLGAHTRGSAIAAALRSQEIGSDPPIDPYVS